MPSRTEASCKNISYAELRHLVKRGGDEVKSSTTKSASASLSHPIDAAGTTLLHLAAKRNDLAAIHYLLAANCDIDAENSSKTTPLLTAVLYNQLAAAELLVRSGADMLRANAANRYPLEMVLRKQRRTPIEVVERFVDRLKSDVEANYDRLAELLARADCSLDVILELRDARLTEALLRCPAFRDTETEDSRVQVLNSMQADDLDNLRVIVQQGAAAPARRAIFFEYLSYRVHGKYPNWRVVERCVTQVLEWQLPDEDFSRFWSNLLDRSHGKVVEMLLRSVASVSSANRYRQQLVARAFGKLDYQAIEAALGIVDVRGTNALHFAAASGREKSVEYLLSCKSAIPNARDDQGRTPLFLAYHVGCVDLLLRYGADVQCVDDGGKTLFESTGMVSKLSVLTANLVILAARGVPINPRVLEKVGSSRVYRRFSGQVEEMKARRVLESVTLFDLLVGKPRQLVRYVGGDRSIVSKVAGLMKGYDFYYRDRISENLNEALARYECMSLIAEVMSDVTGKRTDFDHLTVERIARFLDYKDFV